MKRVAHLTVGGTPRFVDLLRPYGVTATFKDSIVALGTSIAAGAYSGGPTTAYPAFLASRLGTTTARTWTTVNGGLSGDPTSGMLTRLPALLTNRPRWVTVEVSINDCRSDIATISSAQTLANIQSMIALCKPAGATPIVIGSAPFDQPRLVASGNTSLNSSAPAKAVATNTLVSTWAAANGVKFVDLYTALGTDTTHLVDGLHPDGTWQDKWAQAIAAVLLA